MDVLKNKSYKQRDGLYRYTSFPYYYNTLDNKYIYGLTSQLDKNTPYLAYKVKEGDTLDSLALTYYGRPDYFWVIADFNDIRDPLIDLFHRYKTLKIPTITSIVYKE